MIERTLTRVRARLEPMRLNPLGKFVLATTRDLNRVEIFDRSMTLAAQIFTSIFPILIMLGVVVSQRMAFDVANDFSLPPATRQMLDGVFTTADAGTFGIVGALLVLISATSLSRALARMYAVIWQLPRPGAGPASWWRWVAVVLTFALSLLVIRRLDQASEGLTAPAVWGFVIVTIGYTIVLLLVAFVLVHAAVPIGWLLPGALLGGFTMGILSRLAGLWLPNALATGEERFGTIGVAFTYLGYLYVVAFALVLTTIVGSRLVRDEGRVGRWLRAGSTGPEPTAETLAPTTPERNAGT